MRSSCAPAIAPPAKNPVENIDGGIVQAFHELRFVGLKGGVIPHQRSNADKRSKT